MSVLLPASLYYLNEFNDYSQNHLMKITKDDTKDWISNNNKSRLVGLAIVPVTGVAEFVAVLISTVECVALAAINLVGKLISNKSHYSISNVIRYLECAAIQVGVALVSVVSRPIWTLYRLGLVVWDPAQAVKDNFLEYRKAPDATMWTAFRNDLNQWWNTKKN